MVTERTCLQFYRAKKLLKPFGILYKNNMFQFFHRRKIENLDDLSNKANDAIRSSQWDKAETLCQRLREAFPEEIDADDRLAQLYVARENYAKALPYAQAALAGAKNDPEKFHSDLVTALSEQVDFIKENMVS